MQVEKAGSGTPAGGVNAIVVCVCGGWCKQGVYIIQEDIMLFIFTCAEVEKARAAALRLLVQCKE